MEALRALVDTHSMAMGDLDKTTFLLAATDLHRLQQAMADSQALRPQQVALFQDALALGEAACLPACYTSLSHRMHLHLSSVLLFFGPLVRLESFGDSQSSARPHWQNCP